MRIYLDMDGVLVDFFSSWEKVIGKSYKTIKTEEQFLDKAKAINGTDFYFNLNKTKECDNVVKLVHALFNEYHILSSPLKSDENNCIAHKTAWIAKHLIIQPQSMTFTGDKHLYATDAGFCPNILIDDHRRNCESFVKAGGIAIKFKTNAASYDIIDLAILLTRIADETKLGLLKPKLIDLKRKKF